jgi:hypothetical protein
MRLTTRIRFTVSGLTIMVDIDFSQIANRCQEKTYFFASGGFATGGDAGAGGGVGFEMIPVTLSLSSITNEASVGSPDSFLHAGKFAWCSFADLLNRSSAALHSGTFWQTCVIVLWYSDWYCITLW